MSRLIKSLSPKPVQGEKKVISIKILDNHQKTPDQAQEQNFRRTDEQIEAMLQAARQEAADIVEAARAEAEKINHHINQQREELEHEKQAVFEEARQQGFAAGVDEGRQSGFEDYRSLIQSAKEVVHSAKQDYHLHVASSERTILNLGMKAAGRILGQVLDQNSDQFLSIVKKALKEAREYSEIQLHVNPVHYELLLSHKEELIMVFPKETDLYIYPDEELSHTSCIIESANGRIEASIDSQLEEIKRRLFELLESEEQ
ncbi:flagellar assembly protein FliH [Pseudomonas sp. ISL-84]|nr:flagellar assembly protein FliH [Pseudomonas sp. ISL-84]